MRYLGSKWLGMGTGAPSLENYGLTIISFVD